MAGPMTHMLVSQTAINPKVTPMNETLQEILIRRQPFLLLGSVGPDLPAIVDAMSGQHVSDALHDGGPAPGVPTNTTACALYRALKGRDPDCAGFAFLLGYVSHCVADAIVHPIVNAAVGSDSIQHRECELVQDTVLFDDCKGGSIKHIDYLEWLTLCKTRPHDLDATIDLWQPIVKRFYGDHSCRLWILSYETGFSIARQGVPHFTGWFYPSPEQIVADELRRFYLQVRLPLDRGTGNFKDDVFLRAVRYTAGLWQQIYDRFVDPSDERAIGDLVRCWNLNDGTDMQTRVPFDLWSAP